MKVAFSSLTISKLSGEGFPQTPHTCIHTYIHTYVIDHSPLGLFRANETNNSNELNRLRMPTGRRQTSWLCTSAAEELNKGLPRTNPASGQSGT